MKLQALPSRIDAGIARERSFLHPFFLHPFRPFAVAVELRLWLFQRVKKGEERVKKGVLHPFCPIFQGFEFRLSYCYGYCRVKWKRVKKISP